MRQLLILLTQMFVTFAITGVWTILSLSEGRMVDVDVKILGLLALAWGLNWPFPQQPKQ